MKIGILGDFHFGARSDSEFFLDNQIKFLNYYMENIKQLGIQNVLQLGDVLDRRKFVNFKTLHTIKTQFFDHHADVYFDIILGNHDTYNKNTSEVNSLNLLLKEYTNIDVIDTNKTLCFGGYDIAMVSWINEDNYQQQVEFINNCKSDVICGHFEISDFYNICGFNYENGLKPSSFDRFKLTLSGHYHSPSNNGKIYYLGNISQLTWNDFNQTKYGYILDTETLELEFIANPFDIFASIEYNDDINLIEYDFNPYQDKITRVIIPSFETVSKKKLDIFTEMLGNKAKSIDVSELSSSFDVTENNTETTDTLALFESQIDEMTIHNKENVLSYIKLLFDDASKRVE